MKSLIITHSNLTHFPDVSGFALLELLDFSFNKIKTLPSLEINSKLKTLELIKNEISSFKSLDYSMPKSLTHLDFRFNPLTAQRGYKIYMSNKFKQIKTLDNEMIDINEHVYFY